MILLLIFYSPFPVPCVPYVFWPVDIVQVGVYCDDWWSWSLASQRTHDWWKGKWACSGRSLVCQSTVGATDWPWELPLITGSTTGTRTTTGSMEMLLHSCAQASASYYKVFSRFLSQPVVWVVKPKEKLGGQQFNHGWLDTWLDLTLDTWGLLLLLWSLWTSKIVHIEQKTYLRQMYQMESISKTEKKGSRCDDSFVRAIMRADPNKYAFLIRKLKI